MLPARCREGAYPVTGGGEAGPRASLTRCRAGRDPWPYQGFYGWGAGEVLESSFIFMAPICLICLRAPDKSR